MCIIAACQERSLTDTEITNCFQNNSDGAGIAYVQDGKVHIEKGFMTLEEFKKYYAQVDVLPHVVHFRIATSGDVCPEMTHPYIIDSDSKLLVSGKTKYSVLFHNGVIPEYNTLYLNMLTNCLIDVPKGPINDSRVAAIMSSVFGEDILQSLSGKFVTMNPDGDVILWGQFEEKDGVFFSNNGYKRTAQVYVFNLCNQAALSGKKNKRNDKYYYVRSDEQYRSLSKKDKKKYDEDWYEAFNNCPYVDDKYNPGIKCSYDCLNCEFDQDVDPNPDEVEVIPNKENNNNLLGFLNFCEECPYANPKEGCVYAGNSCFMEIFNKSQEEKEEV